mmetsp:Transcript_40213/g.95464  ORF Transcript_40213/g.95464 Transcript_40213/m.95464 type:complete len:614 (+) Transcript_40213:1424-3265(+)
MAIAIRTTHFHINLTNCPFAPHTPSTAPCAFAQGYIDHWPATWPTPSWQSPANIVQAVRQQELMPALSTPRRRLSWRLRVRGANQEALPCYIPAASRVLKAAVSGAPRLGNATRDTRCWVCCVRETAAGRVVEGAVAREEGVARLAEGLVHMRAPILPPGPCPLRDFPPLHRLFGVLDEPREARSAVGTAALGPAQGLAVDRGRAHPDEVRELAAVRVFLRESRDRSVEFFVDEERPEGGRVVSLRRKGHVPRVVGLAGHRRVERHSRYYLPHMFRRDGSGPEPQLPRAELQKRVANLGLGNGCDNLVRIFHRQRRRELWLGHRDAWLRTDASVRGQSLTAHGRTLFCASLQQSPQNRIVQTFAVASIRTVPVASDRQTDASQHQFLHASQQVLSVGTPIRSFGATDARCVMRVGGFLRFQERFQVSCDFLRFQRKECPWAVSAWEVRTTTACCVHNEKSKTRKRKERGKEERTEDGGGKGQRHTVREYGAGQGQVTGELACALSSLSRNDSKSTAPSTPTSPSSFLRIPPPLPSQITPPPPSCSSCSPSSSSQRCASRARSSSSCGVNVWPRPIILTRLRAGAVDEHVRVLLGSSSFASSFTARACEAPSSS